MRLLPLLASYHQARKLKFTQRTTLEQHQQKQLNHFFNHVLSKSPYFLELLKQQKKPYHFDATKFKQWPLMDKSLMLREFDRMNTLGLKRDEAFSFALNAEKNRDFASTLDKITIGLSSGTSGQRGLFAVSEREQATWAGIMLAKMLPHGLLNGERVALFLRAGSNLYQAVKTPCLSFQYYDLLQPFDDLLKKVEQQNPTIIVAPAQVLQTIAQAVKQGQIMLQPDKVISVAEVLSVQDRTEIIEIFPNLHEVYQATEGFLASTCECGKLHLNEEFVYFEYEWLDQYRFIPIITDFSRQTQPIVRYRLNDILAVDPEPCACGSVCTVLSHIEGRSDDALIFKQTTLFADSVSRMIALTLPLEVDYRLTQQQHILTLQADINQNIFNQFVEKMNQFLTQHHIQTHHLIWKLDPKKPVIDFSKKRRRIICLDPYK